MIREGPHWGIDEHRDLLRAMLMTVCDLAAITKPWEIEKRVAELVSSEFFEQGDIEREKLNITPIVSSIYYLHAPFLNTCLFFSAGAGYHEQGETGSVAANAGGLYRLHLPADL